MSHIAVDMDDVVVDFVGGLIAAVKKEHAIDVTHEQLAATGWNLHPLLDPIIGYSWWTWLQEREWLWANFPAIDGAIGGLERLRRQGHYLELVTSKPRWAEHNVWKWLGKWRPPFHSVTIVGKDDPKVDFTPASVLIDDKPANIAEFLHAGRQGLLFSRPHNGTAVLPVSADELGNTNSAVRVTSWPEITTFFEEHTNGR